MATKRPEDHRRKFKAEDYAPGSSSNKRSHGSDSDSETKEAKVAKIREKLQARTYKIDLDSKLGKTTIVNQTTPSNQSGGYYCNVCDCVVKDSINFLDHINGKKHQRNLGMNMKIERSTLDQVKARLEKNKDKIREESSKQKKEYNFEERMKELKEEEVKQKEAKREKKNKKFVKNEDNNNVLSINDGDYEVQNDIASIMGFSGFASSKK
jgi:U4/U6.U5 tri-snRNP component SNU23